MIQVSIQGTTYNLPQQGESPAWGDDLQSLILALVSVSNSVVGGADILTTNFSLPQVQASAANIVGLTFNSTLVRSAIISYSIYRSTSTNEVSECGQIYITYKSSAGTWELAQNYVGTSGVVFIMLPSGQMQYTATTIVGTTYAGKLKFQAKSFLQA